MTRGSGREMKATRRHQQPPRCLGAARRADRGPRCPRHPHAATVGDDETRAKILDERLGRTVAILGGILGRDTIPDIPWSVAYLRARLAEHPAAGYKT